MSNERYQRGWEKLMEVDGEGGQLVAKGIFEERKLILGRDLD
ncbi:hypothetical protein RCG17_10905 [Neobacillus sp. PS3-12]|nr:hypothetical protein [Neobacillus sp. PS3-12]WML55052.1 hypothetical protein RCG17_10905 [Neobacillus sp. PS3-12]